MGFNLGFKGLMVSSRSNDLKKSACWFKH